MNGEIKLNLNGTLIDRVLEKPEQKKKIVQRMIDAIYRNIKNINYSGDRGGKYFDMFLNHLVNFYKTSADQRRRISDGLGLENIKNSDRVNEIFILKYLEYRDLFKSGLNEVYNASDKHNGALSEHSDKVRKEVQIFDALSQIVNKNHRKLEFKNEAEEEAVNTEFEGIKKYARQFVKETDEVLSIYHQMNVIYYNDFSMITGKEATENKTSHYLEISLRLCKYMDQANGVMEASQDDLIKTAAKYVVGMGRFFFVNMNYSFITQNEDELGKLDSYRKIRLIANIRKATNSEAIKNWNENEIKDLLPKFSDDVKSYIISPEKYVPINLKKMMEL